MAELPDLTELTTPDADDILYIVSDPAGAQLNKKITVGNLGVGGGGGTRTTAQYTTGSLTALASETGAITMAKSCRIIQVATSAPARVTFYATEAARTADAGRNYAVLPDFETNHGVMLDIATDATVTSLFTSPQVDLSNMEASPSSAIPIRVHNNSGSTATITVTVTYIATES